MVVFLRPASCNLNCSWQVQEKWSVQAKSISSPDVHVSCQFGTCGVSCQSLTNPTLWFPLVPIAWLDPVSSSVQLDSCEQDHAFRLAL